MTEAPDSQPSLRSMILQSAIRLFGNHGYAATAVRDICEAAGCQKPALYYHFESKSGLYLSAVKEELRKLQSIVADSAGETIRDRLIHANLAVVAHAKAEPHAVRLLLGVELGPDDGRPAFDRVGARQINLKMVELLLAEGVARGEFRANLRLEDAAMIMIGSLTYQYQMQFFSEDPWGGDQMNRTLVMILDSFATERK
jgi:AcrR family transcriptional regulator